MSEAQALANKQNAQKSTGPRTEGGRARSSLNAISHGLTAQAVVVPWEAAEDFEAFRAGLFDALAPVGALEAVLAERVTCAGWRLRRLVFIEAQTVKVRRESVLHAKYDDSLERIGLLNRYEAALERGMLQALHELQRLQAARAGAAPIVPVAVDVTVTGRQEP